MKHGLIHRLMGFESPIWQTIFLTSGKWSKPALEAADRESGQRRTSMNHMEVPSDKE